jgi:hypothetical protein
MPNCLNKGNNKITELRTILQRKVKTHKYINRQNQSTTENCENRNDPDLVQAFLKLNFIRNDANVAPRQLHLRSININISINSHRNIYVLTFL